MSSASLRARSRLAAAEALPNPFAAWFAARGWHLRRHQAEMLDFARQGRDALLIAPTGGGKTLGGFLPSLVELHEAGSSGRLHTLYVSPLKALATDIARNLTRPVGEMGLAVRIETRTGDTPQNRRARQRSHPPDMLLTTPELLALLLSYDNATDYLAGLRCVLLDELHALAESKRGALFSLAIARLRRIAPRARFVGLSATVAAPAILQRFLSPRPDEVAIVQGDPGAEPEVVLTLPEGEMPWAGHMAVYAAKDVYRLIKERRVTLVFVNTRAQAELMFGALWRLNKANLPIGLHHGSLAVEQRRKVEAAMATGGLRAVVCTSSLDLGIDWGDIDLVVQIGAPKGAARLLQRIGRANHRLDEPSRAALVPANRFEVLECIAAQDALAEDTLDGGQLFPGGFDVLAQHVTGVACAGPFDADALYDEVRDAAPFADLARADFDAVLSLRRDRRLCARRLRPLPPPRARRRRAVAAARPEADPPVPDECRHHRRGAGDEGAARAGQGARRGRGVFRLDAHAGRHLPVRRAAARVPGHPQQRGDGRARQDRRATPRCPPMPAAGCR